MNYQHNNGGNPKGVSDCVARALAISLALPYYEVAQGLAPYTQEGGVNVWATGFLDYMEAHGFRYVIAINDYGRTVSDMPANCIVHTASHFTAVVDGCVQDTIDTRNEMVRGYWLRGTRFNVVNAAGRILNSGGAMNFLQAVAMRRMLNLNYSTKTELYAL